MTLAQDEAIAIRIVRPLGVHVQHGEIEGDQDVGGRHLAADVPKLGVVYRLQVAAPHGTCQAAQLFHLLDINLLRIYHLEPPVTPLTPAPKSISMTMRCASRASCRS